MTAVLISFCFTTGVCTFLFVILPAIDKARFGKDSHFED